MGLLAPLPRAEHARELLDGPVPLEDLCKSLADISRLNALFGGRLVTLAAVRRLLARVPPGGRVTVLDVGTGGADIPRALVRWARRAGRPVRVFALDRDRPTVEVARRLAADYPEIVLIQGDALALPFPAGSIDIVISALTLHHLEAAAASASLAAMDEVARLGFVVNDLFRSRLAYGLVWLVTRLATRSRMARHDGPLSVLRAYTADEVRALCEKAGFFDIEIRRYPHWLRQCAVRAKP
jgi:2-polyprenyl-3-methyl-5-hydroxy-6-metoxy-1,4-benzoquinol methylase